MKKFIITVLLFTATGSTFLYASPTNSDEKKLEEVFAADFTVAENVQWSSDADFYYANFTQDGTKVTAVYDKETITYVGYAKIINADNLPSSIRKIIADNYQGYKALGTAAEIGGIEKDTYILTLENEKNILKVKITTDGFSTVENRIKKA